MKGKVNALISSLLVVSLVITGYFVATEKKRNKIIAQQKIRKIQDTLIIIMQKSSMKVIIERMNDGKFKKNLVHLMKDLMKFQKYY